MFFTASKIFWLVAQPSNFILLLTLAGVLLLFTRWRRMGRAFCVVAALLLVVFGALPTGALMLASLENRFPPPPASLAAPDVIVVLGGAIDPDLTAMRGIAGLNDAAGRMTEAVALARRFPNARLVFTGGNGSIAGSGRSEAGAAELFFRQMGMAEGRVISESRSRNTYENAIFTRDLVPPRPGETWLLVTSAFHMPRSMGIFRHAGMPVVAWPAHYYTAPGLPSGFSVSTGLRQSEVAVREFIGLVAYRLTGKTDALYPSP